MILITGHRGFVGSEVVKEAKRQGLDIITFDQDLTKPIPDGPIEYIINIASKAEVSQAIEHPEEIIENNIGIVLALLKHARKYPPKKFIHVSSAEVYGPGQHYSYASHRPTNPYAASKAAQDDIVRSYRATYKLPLSIAVTQNVYGDTQPSHKFYPVIKEKIANNEPVSVVNGIRRFTQVQKLAKKLIALLDEPVGDYHIAGSKMTNEHFARSVAMNLGKEIEIKEIEATRPGHEDVYVLEGRYGK